MSFLNPTPVAVTLYSSADPEAPQLSSNNWTGAIKTILKACLVTGYGSKQGAGWAISDETDNKATITPTDPAMAHIGIIIDSAHKDYSAVDLVWQSVVQRFDANSSGNQVRRLLYISGLYTWRVIASARGFALIVSLTGNYVTGAGMLYFGQTCTNLTDPAAQDFVMINSWDRGGAYSMSYFANWLSANNSLVACTTGALTDAPSPREASNAYLATTAYNSSHQYAATRKLTQTPLQSALYADLYLRKPEGLVARVPGLLVKSHRLISDEHLALVQIDGSPHQWLYADYETGHQSPQGGVGILVNTEQWVY